MSREIVGIARTTLSLLCLVACGDALLGYDVGASGSTAGASSTSGGTAQGEVVGWRSIPVPSDDPGEFESVACPGPHDCWATANVEVAGTNVGQIFHFDGSGWERVPAAGRPLTFYGIACPDADECWAAGNGEDFNQDPISPGILFQALACPAEDECIAIGEPGYDGPMSAYRFDGFQHGEWFLPQQPGESGELAGIACSAATSCMAVGGAPVSGDSVGAVPLTIGLSP